MDREPQVADLIARITELLRPPAGLAAELQSAVERFFEPLELVPRREFDAERERIAALRGRIDALERRLAELERRS